MKEHAPNSDQEWKRPTPEEALRIYGLCALATRVTPSELNSEGISAVTEAVQNMSLGSLTSIDQ